MSAAQIEILAIRRLDGESTVKAFIDIRLGGVVIKGAKVVKQDDRAAWLAMPAVKLTHGWANTVELSKPLREKATEIALAAWESGQ
jgi:DNA-binding cell septation regulator SpoVG